MAPSINLLESLKCCESHISPNQNSANEKEGSNGPPEETSAPWIKGGRWQKILEVTY